MENFKTKCSSKEDENINAISYCGECKIYSVICVINVKSFTLNYF